MKILVTGSNGLVGTFLCDALRGRGATLFTIDLVDNVIPSKSHLVGNLLNLDLVSLFEHVQPDFVIHLAAQVSVVKSIENPIADAESNILSSIKLAEASILSGVKKFLYANSGGAIYDSRVEPPYTEESPIRPISPYGISKYASELYLENILGNSSVLFQSFALSNVYGVHETQKSISDGIIPRWLTSGINQVPLRIRDISAERDFVYVKDVVSAFQLGLESTFTGRLNISTGFGISLGHLLNEVQSLFDYTLEVHKENLVVGEISRSSLSSDKAFSVLGWKPRYDLSAGLLETKNNLISRRKLFKV